MIEFTFTDKSNEKYNIAFGWQRSNACTISFYPHEFDGKSLAMCSFLCDDRLIVDDLNEDWAAEYLSPETKDYINKLLSMKAFW
jgi:hypothetical protein